MGNNARPGGMDNLAIKAPTSQMKSTMPTVKKVAAGKVDSGGGNKRT